jgi:hypothetical protein
LGVDLGSGAGSGCGCTFSLGSAVGAAFLRGLGSDSDAGVGSGSAATGAVGAAIWVADASGAGRSISSTRTAGGEGGPDEPGHSNATIAPCAAMAIRSAVP